jgi:murein L,D-transpeptidase YcbB/YkuD
MRNLSLQSTSLVALTVFFLSLPALAEGPALAKAQPPEEETLPSSRQTSQTLEQAEAHPIESLLRSETVDGQKIQSADKILSFYQARSFSPLWVEGDEISKPALKVIEQIRESWVHGFNPENYHLSNLDRLRGGALDEKTALVFEVLMSDAVARFGHDLTGMRLSPAALKEDTSSWSRGLSADQVLSHVAGEKDAAQQISKLEPHDALYQILKEELRRLVTDLTTHPENEQTRLRYSGLIHPKESHAIIPQLRSRLNLSGAESSLLYDEVLVKAVEGFQSANGLKPDGVIGQRTIAALNQGRTDRLVKVVANMERLRWVGGPKPDRYISVNIPAMKLEAVSQGQVVEEMPVIVGKPSWPTARFVAQVVGVRFNPSWHVPANIKAAEFLPALQKDPTVLARKNIQLLRYTPDGVEEISAEQVDWSTMTQRDVRQLGMVQEPGVRNPLGRIRVLMPNKYDIYLHDTSTPELFSRDFRALSHGCIRLSEPKKIANFVLGKNQGWSEEKMEKHLGHTRTVEIKAESPFSVYVLYNTIWLDREGHLIIGDDVYSLDSKLVNALQSSGKIKLPVSLSKINSL